MKKYGYLFGALLLVTSMRATLAAVIDGSSRDRDVINLTEDKEVKDLKGETATRRCLKSLVPNMPGTVEVVGHGRLAVTTPGNGLQILSPSGLVTTIDDRGNCQVGKAPEGKSYDELLQLGMQPSRLKSGSTTKCRPGADPYSTDCDAEPGLSGSRILNLPPRGKPLVDKDACSKSDLKELRELIKDDAPIQLLPRDPSTINR